MESGYFSLYSRKFQLKIQTLRLVNSPDAINMVYFELVYKLIITCPFRTKTRASHWSEPLCKSDTKLNDKKSNNHKRLYFYAVGRVPNRFAISLQKL